MDYHLKPLGKTCAGTGQPLAPGSVCHSVVVEKDGELLRLDFSEAGWQGPPPEIIGHWKSTVPADPTAGQLRLDPEPLMRYFEQLSEEASPVHDRLRYVLALLLLKYRKLRLDDARDGDGEEVLVLSGLHGEGSFEVPNLQLPDQETQQLQQELRTHLAAEWS